MVGGAPDAVNGAPRCHRTASSNRAEPLVSRARAALESERESHFPDRPDRRAGDRVRSLRGAPTVPAKARAQAAASAHGAGAQGSRPRCGGARNGRSAARRRRRGPGLERDQGPLARRRTRHGSRDAHVRPARDLPAIRELRTLHLRMRLYARRLPRVRHVVRDQRAATRSPHGFGANRKNSERARRPFASIRRLTPPASGANVACVPTPHERNPRRGLRVSFVTEVSHAVPQADPEDLPEYP